MNAAIEILECDYGGEARYRALFEHYLTRDNQAGMVRAAATGPPYLHNILDLVG